MRIFSLGALPFLFSRFAFPGRSRSLFWPPGTTHPQESSAGGLHLSFFFGGLVHGFSKSRRLLGKRLPEADDSARHHRMPSLLQGAFYLSARSTSFSQRSKDTGGRRGFKIIRQRRLGHRHRLFLRSTIPLPPSRVHSGPVRFPFQFPLRSLLLEVRLPRISSN